MGFGNPEGKHRGTSPLLAGLAALFIGGEAVAQQAPGRPITQAEFETRYLSPQERAARRAYEEQQRTDPAAIAAARVREARALRLTREGEAQCAQVRARVRREGYAAVEADIGTEDMMACGL